MSNTPNTTDYAKILTVADLLGVAEQENHAPMVDIATICKDIVVYYEKFDMLPYTGNVIYVRDEVARRLLQAVTLLKQQYPLYTFRVQYGYRHPQIQHEYYTKRAAILREQFPEVSEQELIEKTHQQVAYPEVAGHPTGGAVDLTIVDQDLVPLDMGTAIADYSEPAKCFTYYPDLLAPQKENRALLAAVMIEAGFAPFNGEWWHFSYGDREWASFYGKGASLYQQIDFKI